MPLKVKIAAAIVALMVLNFIGAFLSWVIDKTGLTGILFIATTGLVMWAVWTVINWFESDYD